MRELHVVAVSEDGRHVVLAARKGATARGEFKVVIDDRLAAAIRGDLPRPGEARAPVSGVSPKDIQARLRAGESVEQIAASAGVPAARVERFAGPVHSERERVIAGTRAAVLERSRRGVSALSLGDAVLEHLQDMPGYKPDSAEWSARREESGRWVVQLSFRARSRARTAAWRYDPATREVVSLDAASAALAHADQPAVRREDRPAVASGTTRRAAAPARTAVSAGARAASPGAGKATTAKKAAAARASATKVAVTKVAVVKAPAATAGAKQAVARKAAATKVGTRASEVISTGSRAAGSPTAAGRRVSARPVRPVSPAARGAAPKAAAPEAATRATAATAPARAAKAVSPKAASAAAAKVEAAHEQAAAAAKTAVVAKAARGSARRAAQASAETAAAEAATATTAAEAAARTAAAAASPPDEKDGRRVHPAGPPTLRVVPSPSRESSQDTDQRTVRPSRRAAIEAQDQGAPENAGEASHEDEAASRSAARTQAARQVPARRAAGGRASVPSWSDVLLGTAPPPPSGDAARPSD